MYSANEISTSCLSFQNISLQEYFPSDSKPTVVCIFWKRGLEWLKVGYGNIVNNS